MTETDAQANPDLRNLATVNAAMADAARLAMRAAAEVSLTIVSKTIDAGRLRPLLDAGARTFGENKVQEAAGKWPALRADYPDICLHLIGGLQTNKAADALRLFDVIEVVDRPRLAEALARAIAAGPPEAIRTRAMMVQVNTGREPQKGGIDAPDAAAFVRTCRETLGLPIIGLMAIPPVDEPPAPHFALLHQMAQEMGLPRLSMGMSGDYAAAICVGATDVRVGSAIFGPRG